MKIGRIGTSTEYAEFDAKFAKCKIVAQRGSGAFWFVFEVYPGAKGSVRTLDSFRPDEKQKAIDFAKTVAESSHRFWGGSK
jgi:hypothetical protein